MLPILLGCIAQLLAERNVCAPTASFPGGHGVPGAAGMWEAGGSCPDHPSPRQILHRPWRWHQVNGRWPRSHLQLGAVGRQLFSVGHGAHCVGSAGSRLDCRRALCWLLRWLCIGAGVGTSELVEGVPGSPQEAQMKVCEPGSASHCCGRPWTAETASPRLKEATQLKTRAPGWPRSCVLRKPFLT